MKKLNKAFAVLTVLAMLATLFVAVPASADVLDDARAAQPSATVLFTSDDAMETPVDPDALDADEVFYAWFQYQDLPVDAYIDVCMGYFAWDDNVVAPYAYAEDEPYIIDDPMDYVSAKVETADFGEDNFIHKSGSKYYGRYEAQERYASEDSGITATNLFGWGFLPALSNSNFAKVQASSTFVQPTEDGTFTLYGMAFQKLTGGNTGVTISVDNKTLNGADVAYPSNLLPECLTIEFTQNATTIKGEALVTFTTHGAGATDAGFVIDNSPADGASAPTEAPTDEPTEEPLAPVEGEKQASKSDKAFNQNAFFYEFETPTIPGEVTGLTATFQIPGKDAVEGDVTNVNLTGISNVALNIAAVIKNIPAGQEDTPVTTTYTLTYSVGGVEKTLQWSRTNSLN